MTLTFDAQEEPDLNAVWGWFEFQEEILAEARVRLTRNLKTEGHTPVEPPPYARRLLGYTVDEASRFFDEQRSRLSLLTMFELLATAEAILRTDVAVRVHTRKKDWLSKRFRELAKGKKVDRLHLDEDILETLKSGGLPPRVVSDFRGVLGLRHWLAHGRYWQPKLGRQYTPNDVFDISRALIDAIPSA